MEEITDLTQFGDKAQTHNIERTSPMGEMFVGTCRLCGATGLRASDALLPCANPKGVTLGDSIISAIEGSNAA